MIGPTLTTGRLYGYLRNVYIKIGPKKRFFENIT